MKMTCEKCGFILPILELIEVKNDGLIYDIKSSLGYPEYHFQTLECKMCGARHEYKSKVLKLCEVDDKTELIRVSEPNKDFISGNNEIRGITSEYFWELLNKEDDIEYHI